MLFDIIHSHAHAITHAPPSRPSSVAEQQLAYGSLTPEELVAEGGVIKGVKNIHLQLHCPLGQAHEEPQLQEHPGPRGETVSWTLLPFES